MSSTYCHPEVLSEEALFLIGEMGKDKLLSDGFFPYEILCGIVIELCVSHEEDGEPRLLFKFPNSVDFETVVSFLNEEVLEIETGRFLTVRVV